MKPLRFFVALSLAIAAVTNSSAVTAFSAKADAAESLQVAKNEPSMKIVGSVIELFADSPTKFEIFSITGQLIRTVNVGNTSVRVELPKGFYIVKCDSWTKRVMIK